MDAPRVTPTIDDLVAGASSRVLVQAPDGKSGSTFERVVIDGERYFLKSLSYDRDWIMRVTGDVDHRPFLVWTHGIMAAAPAGIDHAVVAMALEGSGPSAVLGMLMRDVGEHLVPEGDAPLDPATHLRFIDALAGLCARFWGWRDEIGLTTMAQRLRFFAPANIAPELARPDTSPVLEFADQGWALLRERAPATYTALSAVHEQPGPLCAALARTPATFLHGDWKLGNLGAHPDGRVILLDWAYPGQGPACWELAWYLALNRARLPASKQDVVAQFRDALERHGIATEGWYERQLRLALLGMAAVIGWEKALGEDAELGWWVEAVARGAETLAQL